VAVPNDRPDFEQMTDLSKISTKDLVAELATRPAVERVDVGHEQTVEILVTSPGSRLHQNMFDGPQTVLRIWD
jgi:hypothetical protein